MITIPIKGDYLLFGIPAIIFSVCIYMVFFWNITVNGFIFGAVLVTMVISGVSTTFIGAILVTEFLQRRIRFK